MKKLSFIPYIFAVIFFGTGIVSCTKSYDPGDWNLLPEKEVIPEIPEYTGKTISLKVMSFNGKTSSKPANDIPALIAQIKEYDPDLLFLRQVDSETNRADKRDIPKEIAEGLGMEYFFAKAFDYQTGGYGNAVFSKFPIVKSEAITMLGDLSLPKAPEVRSLPMITVKIDDKNQLAFAGTELDPGVLSSRISQISDVLRLTQTIDIPFILAGNFNDKENTQTFDMIKDQFTFGCTGCGFNAPKAAPTLTVDFITYKKSDDFIQDQYNILPTSISTFLPVTAVLKLKLEE